MTDRPTCVCHGVPQVKNGGGRFRCAVKNRERCRVARQTPGTVAFEESHEPSGDGYYRCKPGTMRFDDAVTVEPLPDMYEVLPYEKMARVKVEGFALGSTMTIPASKPTIPIEDWTEEQRNYNRWSKRFRDRAHKKWWWASGVAHEAQIAAAEAMLEAFRQKYPGAAEERNLDNLMDDIRASA